MANQIVNYAAAGALGTSVHYFIMFGLIMSDKPALVATTVGAVVGAFINYLLCFHFVFRREVLDVHQDHRLIDTRSVVRFSVVAVIVIVTNATAFAILYDLTSTLVAQVFATVVAFFAGYAFNRNWSFAYLRKHNE